MSGDKDNIKSKKYLCHPLLRAPVCMFQTLCTSYYQYLLVVKGTSPISSFSLIYIIYTCILHLNYYPLVNIVHGPWPWV